MSTVDPHACDKCGYETTIVEVMTAYQTTGSDDGSPTEEGVKHGVYRFDYNANHLWNYFSAMTSEVLPLKGFLSPGVLDDTRSANSNNEQNRQILT